MDVEIKVDVIRGGARGQGGPRVENDEFLMAMGIAGSLNEALQNATTELSKWLARDYGLCQHRGQGEQEGACAFEEAMMLRASSHPRAGRSEIGH